MSKKKHYWSERSDDANRILATKEFADFYDELERVADDLRKQRYAHPGLEFIDLDYNYLFVGLNVQEIWHEFLDNVEVGTYGNLASEIFCYMGNCADFSVRMSDADVLFLDLSLDLDVQDDVKIALSIDDTAISDAVNDYLICQNVLKTK